MNIPRLPGAEWSRLYCSYRWKAFLVAPTSVFLATSYLRKLMSCFLLFFPSPHLNMPVLTAFLIRISFSESLIIFVSLFSVLFNFSSDIGYSVTIALTPLLVSVGWEDFTTKIFSERNTFRFLFPFPQGEEYLICWIS